MREILRDLGRIAARWLFWSPRHLAVAAVAVVAAVVVLGSLTSHSASHRSAALQSVSPTSSALPLDSTPPPPPVETVPAGSVPTRATVAPAKPSSGPSADPGIAATALAFTRGWCSHPAGVTAKAWLAPFTGYLTPQLRTGLAASDPANVPCTAVTGPARVGAAADGRISVSVPTDQMPVTVTVVALYGQWRVDDVEVTGT